MVILRPYQKEAVAKMMWARTLEGNDLVSLPQGSGKSLVIAELAKQLKEPILILVPSKELLEQDKEKLEHWTSVDVYSAGMKSKVVGNITIGTIQSVYKNPELFTHFKVVIIDEADLVNPKSLDGMYNKLFKEMGNPKIYGLSATCFRMDSYYRKWGISKWQVETVHTLKMLTRYRERFWTRMLYVAHVEDLINEGYLTRLTYHKLNFLNQNQLAFNKSKSEFDMEDFEMKFNPFLKRTAELCVATTHQSLVFVATIQQGVNLASLIPGSQVVSSKTSAKERELIVKDFRSGKLKVAINVGVLLVGFDKPDLLNLIVARPTRSLRLHLQMLGRGMRIHPGKTTCHIYDLVGNVDVLGGVESIRVEKIEGKWNITSETKPEGWHYQEIYSFKIKPKEPKYKDPPYLDRPID